jgi:hypothetical protein
MSRAVPDLGLLQEATQPFIVRFASGRTKDHQRQPDCAVRAASLRAEPPTATASACCAAAGSGRERGIAVACREGSDP